MMQVGPVLLPHILQGAWTEQFSPLLSSPEDQIVDPFAGTMYSQANQILGLAPQALIDNEYLTLQNARNVFTITLRHQGENPLSLGLLLAIQHAYQGARIAIGDEYRANGACLVLTGAGTGIFSTGVPMTEETRGSNILRDAFAPLLVTILTFPFPTICVINGLCEGGACPLSLCHDYRILNTDSGIISFDAIHLGAHFVGIAAIVRQKLSPLAARKMVLEGHRFSAQEALDFGLVDEIVAPDRLTEASTRLAASISPLGRQGSYGLMRKELLGDAISKLVDQCM